MMIAKRIGGFNKIIGIFVLSAFIAITLSSCQIPFLSKKKNTPNKTASKSNVSTTTPSGVTTEPAVADTTQGSGDGNNQQNSNNLQQNGQTIDTPPGSILNVGETWHEGGSELTLGDVSMVNGQFKGMVFTLTYKNNKGHDISFNYKVNLNIKVTDNLNNTKPVIGYSNDVIYSEPGFDTNVITQLVENGKSVSLSNTFIYFLGKFDIGDPKINEITVTASNISNIVQAKWRIPVYH